MNARVHKQWSAGDSECSVLSLSPMFPWDRDSHWLASLIASKFPWPFWICSSHYWNYKCLQPHLSYLHGFWKLELGSSFSKGCRVTPKASLDSKRNENIWGVPKVSVALNCASLYKWRLQARWGISTLWLLFLSYRRLKNFNPGKKCQGSHVWVH